MPCVKRVMGAMLVTVPLTVTRLACLLEIVLHVENHQKFLRC